MRSVRAMFAILLFSAVVPVVSGCGYSFVAPGAYLPDDVRRVYVAAIDERRSDPELSEALERELRGVFRRSGRFELAASEAASDAKLHVAIVSAASRPVAFDDLDEVLDYETTMRVDAVLKSDEGEVLWTGKGIGATRAHAAVAGAVITSSSAFQSSERLTDADLAGFDTVQLGEQRTHVAREQLVVDLATNIYTLMAEGR